MSNLMGICGKARELFELLRFKPFDNDSVGGRARERHRRVVLTALASVVAKSISVVSAIITVPLTLHYLGAERYGLWMAISSVIALAGFTDFGLGNGLINAVARAHGENDQEMAACSVSSAFYLLLSIAVGMAFIFFCAYPWIPWAKVFNVRSAGAVADAGPSMVVFVVCFLIGLPLSVVSRIQAGYQEGYFNSLWQAVGNVLALLCLLVAVGCEMTLPWLVGLMAGVPLVVTLANGIYLFGWRRPWLRPSYRRVTYADSYCSLRMGALFFVLQVAAVFTYASDSVIIAQLFGSATVPEYVVPMRLFSFVSMMLSMMLSPLWPAYGESASRGDVAWIRKTLIRSMWLAFWVTGVPSLLLAIFGLPIINLWVGPEVKISSLLLVCMGGATIMSGVGESVAMFLNGTNTIRFQAVTAAITCLVAVMLKIFLGRWLGVPGVVLGTVLAYGLCTALPMFFFIPFSLRKMGGNKEVAEQVRGTF